MMRRLLSFAFGFAFGKTQPVRQSPGAPDANGLESAEATAPSESGQASPAHPSVGSHAERRWQAAKTQFTGDREKTTELVLGVDFGTLSTRVVVRSPFVAGGRAVPVRWRPRSGQAPHFLPAVLNEGMNGELSLASDWRELPDGSLKTDLMERPDDRNVRARAASYLGLALREARAYVLETQAEAYGAFQLRWAVHLGIPSAGYDDHGVRTAFLRVARAAWILSRRSEPPTLKDAKAVLGQANDMAEIDADPDVTVVEVYPEIAALVVGYARSTRRREGLHVMLDVGASTIDVCGFGLREVDGDDKYSLYTALVQRSGIRELHRRRVDTIQRANAEQLLCVQALLDPFSNVPVSGRDYLSSAPDPLRAALDRLDQRYAEVVTSVLMTVLMDLRQFRDPHSRAWTTGLPLFKAGGGAGHGLITCAVREANRRLIASTTAKGIEEERLPTLEMLDDVDWWPEDNGGSEGPAGGTPRDGVAGRIGVAYGLSFEAFEIGDIVPPADIKDVPSLPLRRPREFTSKDQM